jgi:thiamine-phosphate pyrophosphorylase
MSLPFPVILITSPEDFADEHVLIEAMFCRGLERLHLRKPGKDERAMEKWLFELDPEVREKVVVHGHASLVEAFGLAGSHGTPSSHSISLHSIPELWSQTERREYAFLSPIFDSLSKTGYSAGFLPGELRMGILAWRERLPRLVQNLYAVGGVDAENLASIVDLDFDGAAVLGAVWNASDPLAAWDSIQVARHQVVDLHAPTLPPIESWRERLLKRRGDVNDF